MRTARFKVATSLAVCIALTLGAWFGLARGIYGGQQRRLTDALFQGGKADPRFVVVAIDDASLQAKGRWPWDRRLHAALIDRLHRAGAAVIGYDVLFTEPSSPASDRALRESIARAGNVVLAAAATFEKRPGDVLRATTYQVPIDAAQERARGVAHVNVFPDDDGVVRSLPAVIELAGGRLVPAFGLAVVEPAAATEPLTVLPDGVSAGERFVRTGDAHLMDVNFADKDAFPVISAARLIDGKVSLASIKGKTVLVGVTAVGLGDQKLTPIDKSEGLPGVLVHANAANTIATNEYLRAEPRVQTLAFVFLLALLTALAVWFLRVWLSPVVAAALGAAYVLLTFIRFDSGTQGNLVYPTTTIVLAYMAALALRYLTEFRERRRVTQVFARYVARDVVDEVLASPEGAVATLAGASRPMSVLFADLRGFTAASEKASPQEVVAALNVYLDAMTQAVVDERGTVDKFMGDCVMAFWGAPRPEPEHAERATRAAIRMLANIEEALKERPEAATLRVKGCGVGIATGGVVVGNIGSHERLDYTVIGDTVNTASRLCGVAGPGELIVSEATHAALGEGFNAAELPPLVVKGKVAPLRVYQVLRPGQSTRVEALEAEGAKGHFTPAQPPPEGAIIGPGVKEPAAAGYAPIEPVPEKPV